MGQSQGHELPFDIGDKCTCLSGKSIWSVHAGKRKVDLSLNIYSSTVYVILFPQYQLRLLCIQVSGDPVTVFVFDYTDKSADEVSMTD